MRKRRKDTRARGSLAQNVLYFCLSISILVGTSILFFNIIQGPDLPLKGFFTKPSVAAVAGPAVPLPAEKASQKETQPETATLDPSELSFYKILSHQNSSGKQATEQHFGIQVGAFKSYRSAQQYRDELKENNRLDCRLVKKGDVTVVVWGNFPTKSSAERSNKQLSRILERHCLVIEMG